MQITRKQTNGDPRVTGAYMHEMVRRYWSDMLPLVHLSLPEVYEKVKNVPYRPDPPEHETLQRPLFTMNSAGFGGDCDDKAIAMACWAYANGMPYRFVAVRRRGMENLHHVYTELYNAIIGKWITADATYPINVLGRTREAYEQYVII